MQTLKNHKRERITFNPNNNNARVALIEGWTFTVCKASTLWNLSNCIASQAGAPGKPWSLVRAGFPHTAHGTGAAPSCLVFREGPLPSCAVGAAALQQYHVAEAWSGTRSLHTDFAPSRSGLL